MPGPANSLNISQIGLVNFDGVNSFTGVTVTQYDVLIGGASNGITSVGPGLMGQILQSRGGGNIPQYSTATYPATAGSSGNILTSDGTNWLSEPFSGGGFTWTDVTGSTQALVAQNGYVTDRSGGVTYTLPASGTLGDIIKIVGKSGIAVITPNASQQILIGSTSGLAGVTGTATSNDAGDCIELICITAGASTVWRADSVVGTWTLVTS